MMVSGREFFVFSHKMSLCVTRTRLKIEDILGLCGHAIKNIKTFTSISFLYRCCSSCVVKRCIMEFRQHLLDAVNEIIANLEEGGHHGRDSQQISLRLTVLCEAALMNGDISLEIIDLMDQARRLVNVTSEQQRSFDGYEAPAVNEEGRRGRPKFAVSEQQLLFFKGWEYSIF